MSQSRDGKVRIKPCRRSHVTETEDRLLFQHLPSSLTSSKELVSTANAEQSMLYKMIDGRYRESVDVTKAQIDGWMRGLKKTAAESVYQPRLRRTYKFKTWSEENVMGRL